MTTNTSLVVAAADSAVTQTTAQTSAPPTVATTQVEGKGGFTAQATVGQLMEFQLTGLLVVFVVLGAITVVSMFSSWLLKIVAPNQYYGKSKTPS
jgi:hypothetical protein